MRNAVWFLWVWLLAFSVLVPGCALWQAERATPPSITRQEVESLVKEAQQHLTSLQQIKAEQTFPQEMQAGSARLASATEFLQQHYLIEARQAAQESLSIFQTVLKTFYQQNILPAAERTRRSIGDIVTADTDSPLQEFIPVLDDILSQADQIETGDLLIDPQKVARDFEAIGRIEDNTVVGTQMLTESDVFFDSGQSELTNAGKRILDTFLVKILRNKKAFGSNHPGFTMLLKLKVVGYSDLIGFRKGGDALKQLSADLNTPLPPTPLEQKAVLNQRLSQRRAQKICDYLVARIELLEPIAIEKDVLGLGEQLPPGIPAPHPQNDPRRRICKIYSHFDIMK